MLAGDRSQAGDHDARPRIGRAHGRGGRVQEPRVPARRRRGRPEDEEVGLVPDLPEVDRVRTAPSRPEGPAGPVPPHHRGDETAPLGERPGGQRRGRRGGPDPGRRPPQLEQDPDAAIGGGANLRVEGGEVVDPGARFDLEPVDGKPDLESEVAYPFEVDAPQRRLRDHAEEAAPGAGESRDQEQSEQGAAQRRPQPRHREITGRRGGGGGAHGRGGGRPARSDEPVRGSGGSRCDTPIR